MKPETYQVDAVLEQYEHAERKQLERAMEKADKAKELSLRWKLTLWFCLFLFGVLAVVWALGWLLERVGL